MDRGVDKHRIVDAGTVTVLVATHDARMARLADDIFDLRDGHLHPAST